MKVLVTGAAGFVGSNLVLRLLKTEPQTQIVGLDSVNDYYDVKLKEWRLSQIEAAAGQGRWSFVRGNLADKALIDSLFAEHGFDIVVNLAAQAGVRYSITNPGAYIESNLVGFYNILEACRHHPVQHLVYASSSSVYGGNVKVPFSEEDKVDNPVSLYAATKKSNELLAIPTASSTTSLPPGCGSSPSMALREGPTWPTSASPTSSSRARPSRYSTTATAGATSPTSMTSWKASSAS